jgi:glycosyltransferase involved in cell wall biosynthesis
MDIKFSIIIPSFNSAKPLLLTLTSLELQTFPKDRFEVIVVNDGSKDQTEKVIKSYKPPYSLIYIANDARQGRSVTRNIGVKRAKGKYLIFLDADFLVVPEFLEVLNTYHHEYPRHVISGFPESLHAVFTHYYPEFSDRKKEKMRQILVPHGLWKHSWLAKKRIANVLTPDDLRKDFGKLRSVVLPSALSETDYKEFKSTDVAPWLLFVTRCVSVKRKYFKEVGGFQERFIKYGFEDWELGYRLHKHGLSYRSIDRIIGYHQEHPSMYRRDDLKLNNLRTFYELHGSKDPEISLISVCHPWEDLSSYKTLLRTLAEWKGKDKEYKQMGRIMEEALHHAAKAFIASRSS